MTEAQIKLVGAVAIAMVLIAGGFATAWFWQANAYGKVIATNEADRQADLAAISNAGAKQARDALAAQQAAEARAAAADEKYTKEKSDGLAQTEALRRAVTDGTRRLRIAATCSGNPGSGNVSQAYASGGVGDAATVELSRETGQAVLDLRASIIADQTALKAAQAYIKDVCY